MLFHKTSYFTNYAISQNKLFETAYRMAEEAGCIDDLSLDQSHIAYVKSGEN
jgi:hypothetical protein